MTCYLNSLIQCLFHLRVFRRLVFEIGNRKSKISTELRTLFGKMQIATRPVRTLELTEAFGWDGDELWAQQDVQELMHFLLERLDDSSGGEMSKLFKGRIASYVRCPGYASSSDEIFWDLSLQVDGFGSLEASLCGYFEPDQLCDDDQYTLPDGSKTDAVKETEIIEAPKVLCLHLRRFGFANGAQRKITSRFDYPENLSFHGEDYQLCSIISHFGRIHTGHYCAYAKVEGLWTNFNDEHVRRCEAHEVFEENFGGDYFTAYVLFYAQRGFGDVPDPALPDDIREELCRRKSELKIYLQFGDWGNENWLLLPCDRNLSSDQFVRLLAAESNIPVEKLVIREMTSTGPSNEVIADPLPSQSIRIYIDDSEGIPVSVRFWLPCHEIVWLTIAHVELGQTADAVAPIVSRLLQLGDVPLRCFIDLEDNAIVEASGEILEAVKLLFEPVGEVRLSDAILKKFKFKEAALPKGLSHLNLLPEEFQISSVVHFKLHVNSAFPVTFRAFDQSKTFKLTLSNDLTFDQTVRCLAKYLEVDPKQIVIIPPSNGFIPARREFAPTLRDLKHRSDFLIYEVAKVDVTFANRFDITVIEPGRRDNVSRFPIYLPRLGSHVKSLRQELDTEMGHADYSLFYMTDVGPTLPIDDAPHEELRERFRIICQIGRLRIADDEQLLRVIYCDEFLLGSNSEKDIPFLAKAAKPVAWKDVKAMFENQTLCLVKKGVSHLERIDADGEFLLDGSEGEMVAVTYEFDKFDPSLYAVMNTPLRMRKEFQDDDVEDGTNEGKEEEEEAEEPDDEDD
jgi:hypothetical protein